MSGIRTKLAIVTPVFNEADNLERYVESVTKVLLDHPDLDASVLFVDDGSSDESWTIIEKAAAADPRFKGVRLSRNFGSHNALSAGLLNVDADVVATLAADLQDPPDTILKFVEQWKDGAKIVWGVRASRQDTSWRVWTSKLFQRLLTRYAMPKGSKFATGSFFLIDRQVLHAVREFKEANRITFALVAWTGFDQARVEYHREERTAGTSGWGFRRMIKAMYDAFLGYSTLPISLMTAASLVSLVIAGFMVAYLLFVRITGTPVPGWTSQMLIMSAFFCVQFGLMAIVGQYLSRIYIESVQRPLYFVSERTSD